MQNTTQAPTTIDEIEEALADALHDSDAYADPIREGIVDETDVRSTAIDDAHDILGRILTLDELTGKTTGPLTIDRQSVVGDTGVDGLTQILKGISNDYIAAEFVRYADQIAESLHEQGYAAR